MNTNQYKKIVVLAITIIILLVAGLSLYNFLGFRLLNTDPEMGNFSASASFIKLRFNKNLSGSILVSGTNGLVSSYSITKSSLLVSINIPLDTGINYHLRLSNIRSVGGQRIKDMDLQFKPRLLPESSLSADQRLALNNAQQQYNSALNDKLISILPFSGGGGEFLVSYDLKYSGQTTIPIVIITAPDQKSQNDAISWIKLIGADPSKYEIQYVTAQP